VDNSCYIGNIYGASIDPATGTLVGVDSTGKLGTMSSSARFKHDIQPIDMASEAILKLNPVRFHYKSDPKNTPCFGLIAEEVAKVNSALIVRDKDGNPYSVRYDAVNTMLLNEFLKAHRRIEHQDAIIISLQKQIEDLKADFQKMSTQVNAATPSYSRRVNPHLIPANDR
jgi:hypothetical protein